MFNKIFEKRIQKHEHGFTLVEMLVSMALFSIVIVVIMGSILTIVDVNRKSQSLTVVMNDLNFVLESITRTVKTGEIQDVSDGVIRVTDQNGRDIRYRWNEEEGTIERDVDDNGTNYISLTSDQIEITDADFVLFDNNDNYQPRLLIAVEGEVTITERIRSAFKIQTSVAQRNLDDDHF